MLKALGEDLARIRNFEDVRLNIIRPECAIANHLSSIADMQVIVREICGATFPVGVKPKTPLLNIELHEDEVVSEIRLTPIL